MAKFKFRLEVLLKLALNKEEEVKKELASWQNLIQEAKLKLQMLLSNIAYSLNEKSTKKHIDEIILYEIYLESLRITQIEVQDEILYFEKEKDKTIIKLQEAMKERKILEKLKEKKKEQHYLEENMIEQKETDEIGSKIFTDGR